MKIKNIFLSFLLAIVGVLSVFSLTLGSPDSAYALSNEAEHNVWDGNAVTEDPGEGDYYVNTITRRESYGATNRDVHDHYEIYIRSIKGFMYFVNQLKVGNTPDPADVTQGYIFKSTDIVYLETDLDLDYRELNAASKGWESITSFNGSFQATFDAQGHTIYNLMQNSATENIYAGLFTRVNGTIKNLRLENVSIGVEGTQVGAIAGYAEGATIENCLVSGNISAKNKTLYLGGLVGYAKGANISKCKNSATIDGGVYTGGLLGGAEGNVSISQALNDGNVSSSEASYIGGLVGQEKPISDSEYLKIENCYNAGDVSVSGGSQSNIGGLVGQAETVSSNNYLTIKNSFNAGDLNISVLTLGRAGGLVGVCNSLADGIDLCFQSVFAVGNITATANVEVNPIVIATKFGTGKSRDVFYNVDENYEIGGISTEFSSIDNLTQKAQSLAFFESVLKWDKDIWGIEPGVNNSYPHLLNCANFDFGDDHTSKYGGGLALRGEGTKNSPYLIYTSGDLSQLIEYYNSSSSENGALTYYSLQNDIDISEKAWTPIGIDENHKFANAVFEGNNYKIIGLNMRLYYIENGAIDGFGFFGYTSNSIVKNVIFDDVRFFLSTADQQMAATDIGLMSGVIENSYFINCGNNSTYRSFGETMGGSYLVYGENNVVNGFVKEYGIRQTANTPKYGYLYTINPDGGILYNEIGNILDVKTGRIQIISLVEDINTATGEQILKVSLNVGDDGRATKIFDNDFIPALPTDTQIGEEDAPQYTGTNVLVKSGYKLSGFSKDTDQYTIKAIWVGEVQGGNETSRKVTYTINYNIYESSRDYSEVDAKTVSLVIKYNEVMSVARFKAELQNYLASEDVLIEREGYKIVGIYQGYNPGINEFIDPIEGNDANNKIQYIYTNKQFSQLYIKWEGNADYQLMLALVDYEGTGGAMRSNGNDNGYNGNFMWDDAVESVIAYNTTSLGERVTMPNTGHQWDNLSKISSEEVSDIYEYNTSYVDEHAEGIVFVITLKKGFEFVMTEIITNFHNEQTVVVDPNVNGSEKRVRYNENFGVAYVSPVVANASNLDDRQVLTLTLKNIVGSNKFEINIIRSSSEFHLSTDDDIKFAIATYETVDQNHIFFINGNSARQLTSLTSYTLTDEKVSFGINMLDENNQYILTTNKEKGGDYGNLLSNRTYTWGEGSSGDSIRDNDLRAIYGSKYASIVKVTGILLKINDRYYLFEYVKFNDVNIGEYVGEYLYEISSAQSGITYGADGGRQKYSFERVDRIAYVEKSSKAGGTTINVGHYTNAEFKLIFLSPKDGDNYKALYYNTSTADPDAGDLPEVLLSGDASGVPYNYKISYGFHKLTDGTNYASYAQVFANNKSTLSVSTSSIFAKFNITYYNEREIKLEQENYKPRLMYSMDGSSYYEANGSFQIQEQTFLPGDTLYFAIYNADFYQWRYRPNAGRTNVLDYFSFDNFNDSFSVSSVTPGEDDLYFLFTLSVTDTLTIKATDYEIKIRVEEKKYQLVNTVKFRQTSDGFFYDEDPDDPVYKTTKDLRLLSPNADLEERFSNLTDTLYKNLQAGYTYQGRYIGYGNTFVEYTKQSGLIKVTLQDLLAPSYRNYAVYDEETDLYVFNIYESWVSKPINYNFARSSGVFKNYNGYANVYYYFASPSVLFDAEGVNEGTYYFTGSKATANTVFDNIKLKFNLSSINSRYYTVCGLALISVTQVDDGILESPIVADVNNYDPDEGIDGSIIEQLFRNKIVDGENESEYGIVPLLLQKTLNIQITDPQANSDKIASIVYYYSNDLKVNFETPFSYKRGASGSLPYRIISPVGSEYSEDLVLDNYFSGTITGYASDGWKVGNSSASVTQTPLINYFAPSYSQTSGEYDYLVSVKKGWTAAKYTIAYNGGVDRPGEDNKYFGDLQDSMTNTSATYDTMTRLRANKFKLTGYNFAGWQWYAGGAYTDAKPITAEQLRDYKNYPASDKLAAGLYYDGIDYYAYNLTDVNQRTVTVYAVWQAKDYTVRIHYNGGLCDLSIVNDYIDATITYNTQFSKMTIAAREYTLSNVIITRQGFTFDGYYVFVAGNKADENRIDNDTVFTNAIVGFNDKEGPALDIYATWRFTEDTSITFDGVFETQYSGSVVTATMDKFATNLESTGLTVINDEQEFSITSNAAGVTVVIEFSGAGITYSDVINEEKHTYSFKTISANVGRYELDMTIRIADDSGLIYNLGDSIYSTTITLTIIVEKAVLFAEYDLQKMYLANLKYIQAQVETEDEVAKFAEITDQEGLENYILDHYWYGYSGLSLNIMYEFLMMKYYNMFYATSNEEFLRFRNWSYVDYNNYYENTLYFGRDENAEDLTGVRSTRQTVLSSMFIYMYDIENGVDNELILSSVKHYSLGFVGVGSQSAGVAVKSEVELLSYRMYVPDGQNVRANQTYSVRAYIWAKTGQGSSVLNNYNISYRGFEAYFEIGRVLILSYMLKLTNQDFNQRSFYQGENLPVSMISDSITSYGVTYYAITGTELYINIALTTSNPGASSVDTLYTFYDGRNHFNYSSYTLVKEDGAIYAIQDDIAVLLDESFEFTIVSTKGKADITYNLSMMTKQNSLVEVLPFEGDALSTIFCLSSFKYTTDYLEYISYSDINCFEDASFYLENIDGEMQVVKTDKPTSGSAIFLLSVKGTGTATPTIEKSGLVSEIIVDFLSNASLKKISDEYKYTRLYNITSVDNTEFISSLNGAYEYENAFTQTFDLEDDSLPSAYTWNVVYTDLVLVKYNYNLVGINEMYNDVKSYLQLGVDKIDDITRITYSNLELVDLYYRTPGDVEVSYDQIFRGEDGIYIGAVESNIFAPIELKAYWTFGELDVVVDEENVVRGVGSFPDGFYVSSAIRQNYIVDENLFTYVYQLIDEEGNIMQEDSMLGNLLLELTSGGRTSDNGRYTVKIVLTINDVTSLVSYKADSVGNITIKDKKYTYTTVGSALNAVSGEGGERYQVSGRNITIGNTTYIWSLSGGILTLQSQSLITELEFSITFVPRMITSLELDVLNSTYNGQDQSNRVGAKASYVAFERAGDDGEYIYAQNATQTTFTHDSGMLQFIAEGGDEVQELIDAGEYTIKFNIDETFYQFDTSVLEAIKEAKFIIERYTLDMQTLTLEINKKFNTPDDLRLSRMIVDTTETIEFEFSRKDRGEMINVNYDLYLSKFGGVTTTNYILKYGDVVLYDSKEYENGYNTEACENTVVAHLTIVPSDRLQVYWAKTDEISDILIAEFSEVGFTTKLSYEDQKVYMTIESEGKEVYKVELRFYDIVAGVEIKADNVMLVIGNYLAQLNMLFTSGVTSTATARNIGVYTFSVDMASIDRNETSILSYYSSITFDSSYCFNITTKLVDTSAFYPTKQFDNNTDMYLDLDGEVLEDVVHHEGYYIRATFASAHAGQGMVSLAIYSAGSGSYNVNNYTLSNSSVAGEILPIDATMKFTMVKDSYEYGQLTSDLLQLNIGGFSGNNINYTLIGDDGEDYTTLFASAIYTTKFDLSNDAENTRNAKGYYYAGVYKLVADITSRDFNIKVDENAPNVTITKTNRTLTITEADHIVITVVDKIAEYYEIKVTDDALGDVYYAKVIPVDAESRKLESAIEGTYNLKLYKTTYLYNSIELSLANEINGGFIVKASTSDVYITFEDENVLAVEYNSKEYTLSLTSTGSKLTTHDATLNIMSNDSIVASTKLKFSYINEGAIQDLTTEAERDITGLEITLDGTALNVNTYRLNISQDAEVQGFSGDVYFRNTYSLTITAIEIDVAEENFANLINKKYDGLAYKTITGSAFQVADGDWIVLEEDANYVIITARYNSVSAGNTTAALFLSGDRAGNYRLSSYSVTTVITKETAYIRLSKTSFVYGEFTTNNIDKKALGFEIYTKNGEVENVLSNASFSFNWEVKYNPEDILNTYYFRAKEYTVQLTTDGAATNYELVTEDATNTLTFTITPYALTILFEKEGYYTEDFNTAESKTANFVRSYRTIYGDVIEIEFTRKPNMIDDQENYTAIGSYYIESGRVIKDGDNQNVAACYADEVTVQDEVRGYAITPVNTDVYILASTEKTVAYSMDNNDYTGATLSFEYTGITYDTIVFGYEDGKYVITLSQAGTDNALKVEAGVYIFADNEYVLMEGLSDETLRATLSISSSTIKNVGPYSINASTARSSLFNNIHMGLSNRVNAYRVQVTKRVIAFKDDAMSMPYTAQAAQYTVNIADFFESVNDRSVALDKDIKVEIEFRTDDVYNSLGIQAGDGYKVVVRNTTLDNYEISQDGSGKFYSISGAFTTGSIIPASLILDVNTYNVVYGDTSVDINAIPYRSISCPTVADLSTEGQIVSIKVAYTEEDKAPSGYLKVGSYGIYIKIESPNFQFEFEEGALKEYTFNDAFVITPRALSVSQKSEPLAEIFTKTYDGTTACSQITDEDGNLRFNISGIVAGDEDGVTIVAAEFASSAVGYPNEIIFTLGAGVTYDLTDNYTIQNWRYGSITAINVNFKYQYDPEYSFVEDNVLTAIAYPFVYLTSVEENAIESGKVIPTLTGYTGHDFTYWGLTIEATTQDQAAFLQSALAQSGCEYRLTGSTTYIIRITNTSSTLRLLNYIIGLDETNFLGYYFKENLDGIDLTLIPVWDLSTMKFTVVLEDEKGGNPLDYAAITVNGSTVNESGFNYEVYFGSNVDIVIRVSNALITAKVTNIETSESLGEFTSASNVLSYSVPSIGIIEAMTVKIYFSFSDLNVELDLSQYDQSKIEVKVDDDIEHSNVDGVYTFVAPYEKALTLTVSDLPEIIYNGHILSKYLIKTALEEREVEIDSDTKLIDYVFGGKFCYKATFTEKTIRVVLDFGHDDLTDSFDLGYNEQFNSNAKWQEVPVYTGYTFLGWFDSAENKVIGTDKILTRDEEITLTAKWGMYIYITVQGAQVTSCSHEYTLQEKRLFFTTLGVGDTLRIELEMQAGFEIVATNDQGEQIEGVTITYLSTTISPEESVAKYAFEYLISNPPTTSITIATQARTNTISVVGNNIESVSATIDQVQVDVEDNKVKVATGKVIVITITTVESFAITDIVVSDGNVEKEINYTNKNTAVITLTGSVYDYTIRVVTQSLFSYVTLSYDKSVNVYESIVSETPNEDGVYAVEAGGDLILTITMKYGYVMSAREVSVTYCDFTLEVVTEEENNQTGTGAVYTLTLKALSANENVRIGYQKRAYTLSVVIVAYDNDLQPVEDSGNIILMDGEQLLEKQADYEDEISLSAQAYTDLDIAYSFVGWSDENSTTAIPFSQDNPYIYRLMGDKTIYAIFSATQYQVYLDAFDYYTLGEKSGIEGEENRYDYLQLEDDFYDNLDSYFSISYTMVHYGAYKTVYFKVPDGYVYYGYGFFDENRNIIENSVNRTGENERTISISLSYFGFEDYVIDGSVYLGAILRANEAKIDVKSVLAYEDYEEDDPYKIGSISLCDETGSNVVVNNYGYIQRDRIHYSDESHVNGQLRDSRTFQVVAYTGDSIYIRVMTQLEGFYFSSFEFVGSGTTNYLGLRGTYHVYEISNLVGGADTYEIRIVFRPILNTVDINFINENEEAVDAGSIYLHAVESEVKRVWVSGETGAETQVISYTNEKYDIYAYIRLGYRIADITDVNIVFDEEVLTISGIEVKLLDHIESNYLYQISFTVETKASSGAISIPVVSQTYTVDFKDPTLNLVSDIVFSVTNVEYNKPIDLSIDNTDNITINQEFINTIKFNDLEILNIVQRKDEYNFGGYFTSRNGKGTQIISPSGEPIDTFKLTGYRYDVMQKKYVLEENAALDEEGNVIITLFLYWSYLKTQIRIEFIPEDLDVPYNAQDIISGVDSSNSWFNSDDPLYMEVDFNTNIKITAPQLDTYIFYRYVISQKDVTGVWLNDVEAYIDTIPWSTNEYDNIVECVIKIEYFVHIGVKISGGTMQYKIIQEDAGGEGQNAHSAAQSLVSRDYIDTTKDYSLTVIPEADISLGFQFISWFCETTATTYLGEPNMTIEQAATEFEMNYVLNVEGRTVKLDLSTYDPTYGQIYRIIAVNPDGIETSTEAGDYADTEALTDFERYESPFEVKVGDEVNFHLHVDYGYTVLWNLPDIKLKSMTFNGILMKVDYVFSYVIGAASAEKEIEILPTFTRELVAIYAELTFKDGEYVENAIDDNRIENAGYMQYKTEKTTTVVAPVDTRLIIDIVVLQRYKVDSIKLTLLSGEELDLMELFDGRKIELTTDYMEENGVAGTMQLKVEFVRLYFGDEEVESEHGSGTEDDPYLIYTVTDLAYYMNLINSGAVNGSGTKYADSYYRVMRHLYLSDKYWHSIGTDENPFNGTFDFDGKVITNIYLLTGYANTYYNGLFGVLGNDAKIIESKPQIWVIVLIVVISVALVITLTVIIIINIRRKKRLKNIQSK